MTTSTQNYEERKAQLGLERRVTGRLPDNRYPWQLVAAFFLEVFQDPETHDFTYTPVELANQVHARFSVSDFNALYDYIERAFETDYAQVSPGVYLVKRDDFIKMINEEGK